MPLSKDLFTRLALASLTASLIAVDRHEITESPHLPSSRVEIVNPYKQGLRNALRVLNPPLDLRDDDPWVLTRRASQTPPLGNWRTWLIMAGRGFGKTRTGAEFIREEVMAGRMRRVALVGATAADVRDVMIEGEALALDTPIPTTGGWTTMEALRPGDTVFDESGMPCSVVWVSAVAEDRPCFDVTLSDGETIVADANHQWLTHTRRARLAAQRSLSPEDVPFVVTTAEMAATVKAGGWNNHAIALPGPLHCAEADLPLDPYVLGAWLGDGRSRGGDFTSADPEILEAIREAGYVVRSHGGYGHRICGIDAILRDLGVLGSKHVPAVYLRASIRQRLALLQGLMDTDGYVSERGQCAFDGNNPVLIGNVRELIRGLGMTCGIQSRPRVSRAFPNAKPMLRLTFTPTMPVARLPRKAERIRPMSRKASWRMVTAVTPRPSVPVRCIAVDSPSHLFLAGAGCVPTHNSGLLACCERYGFGAKPELSRRRITFANGAIATLYSAEEPNRLRGPQHDGFWADEVAAWNYADAWDQLQFGLRLGQNPRGIATTTPKPVPVIKDLVAQTKMYYDDDGNAVPTDDPLIAAVAITSGSTYENRANLAPPFLSQVVRRYEGTRLGRQEISGELLMDVVGALWSLGLIDAYRVPYAPKEYDLSRIVVGVDPMIGEPSKKARPSEDEGHSETGIVVAATGPSIDFLGRVVPQQDFDLEHAYVLEDASMSGTPGEWAKAVIDTYHRWKADRIVAEINQGGLMVEHTLRTEWPGAPITLVHASRGKLVRAEPVSALYEKGRVHHVGQFLELEDQLAEYDGTGDSPDRLDALVWAMTDLLVGDEEAELDLATLGHFNWKGGNY